MGKTDAHLTIFSTTAIESLSLGKPTFLYNFEGAAMTYVGSFLASNPNAYFCNTEEDFLKNWEALPLRSKEAIAESNGTNISANYSLKLKAYLQTL